MTDQFDFSYFKKEWPKRITVIEANTRQLRIHDDVSGRDFRVIKKGQDFELSEFHSDLGHDHKWNFVLRSDLGRIMKLLGYFH